MPADEVVRMLEALADHGARAVVGGGWGVDALVGHQTHEHSDLDLRLSAEAFEAFVVAVGELGIDRLSAWPGDRPWNFVVGDGGLLRLDLHLFEPVDDVDVHCGSAVRGVCCPCAALEGHGSVAGRVVRCESLPWSLRWHQDHQPRDVDRHDVTRLCQLASLLVPHGYELSD